MQEFKANAYYRVNAGAGEGQQFFVKVLSRTAKTVTVETPTDGVKRCRIKTESYTYTSGETSETEFVFPWGFQNGLGAKVKACKLV